MDLMFNNVLSPISEYYMLPGVCVFLGEHSLFPVLHICTVVS